MIALQEYYNALLGSEKNDVDIIIEIEKVLNKLPHKPNPVNAGAELNQLAELMNEVNEDDPRWPSLLAKIVQLTQRLH